MENRMQQKRSVKKTFTFTLGEKDKQKYAMRVVQLKAEAEGLCADKAGAIKLFNYQIAEKNSEILELVGKIQTGEEEREIRAEEIFNFEAGEVSYLYNGKVIMVRDMEDSEKIEHQQLQFDELAKKEPEKFVPVTTKCARCDSLFTARGKFNKICENCQKLDEHRFAREA